MLIALNARFLIKDKLEGIGWYSYEMFKRLVLRYPQHTFLMLFDREPDASFIFGPNVIPVKVWPPARHPYLWQFWFDYSLPSIFKKYKPDLFFSPDGFLSLKTHIPTLLAIHDLGFEHYPEHTPSIVHKYYQRFTPLYAQHADQIVTVSEFSRKDIIQQYQVPATKVHAIHNGASLLYQPVPEDVRKEVRNLYTGGSPYFIYVGSIHPRKNVRNLLLAFDALKSETETEIRLLIAGRMAWKTGETQQVYEQMRWKDHVVFAGHTEQAELARIMASAEAMVYPSLFEGFGIPIVEARYCEVPVITSDRSSLPEVAGPNAIYFDPVNVGNITAAMQEFLKNADRYRSLCEPQQAVKEAFNWDKAASALAGIIAQMDKRFETTQPQTLG